MGPKRAASNHEAEWERLGEQRIALVSVLEELTVSALDLFEPSRSADAFLDRLAERLGCYAALLVEHDARGVALLHGATGISSASRRLPLPPEVARAWVEDRNEGSPYPELARPGLVRWHFAIEEPPRVRAALILFFDGQPTLPAQYRGMVRRLSDMLRTVLVHRQLYAATRENERALDEKRTLLECVSDAANAGILVIDGADQVVFVNRRLADLWGLEVVAGRSSRRELLSRMSENIEQPQAFEAWIDALSRAGAERRLELRLHDGRVLECDTARVRSSRADYGLGLFFRDVTGAKRAEAERERLLETERGARELAEAALRSRDEFISIASHELRTPLTTLQLVVQTALRDAQGDDELRLVPVRAVRNLARQTQRLARLVDTLLDASRFGTGKVELQREPVDLVDLAREVVERFDVEVARTGATLTLERSDPVVANVDRSRIDQVLTNLISNAIKYGRGLPITVSIRRQGDEAVVLVHDQGLGVPADRIGHVFERFERAVSSRQFGGLGLGLFIVREIVEAHGGKVTVESELGRGSTFRVALPVGG